MEDETIGFKVRFNLKELKIKKEMNDLLLVD